ncbi:saccharopine dehydrogenase family protein [Candidatus Bathyarchaeota archaeon]|nr:MAG: saccharopine dehydrogenase family protein [Candidatus Bathyarchaeota archaeon]
MNVIILGSGKIGSIIGREFASIQKDSKITMADSVKARASQASSAIHGSNWTTIDITDYQVFVEKLTGYDLIIGALPGDYGWIALKASIEAGVNMLDVSYTPEDPTVLNRDAEKRSLTIIPDCGVAPGLSSILVGYATSKLDTVRDAHIMVGGIPEKPVPPLGYTITWSADGLVDEYIRDVKIIEKSKTVQVPALSGLEQIDFPGVGTLEAFYTDGLRTLAKSITGVESMWEKTLRYPGHVEKVKLLKALGFFDEEPLKVGEQEVLPKTVTARLFERSLWMPDVGDLLAMQITVRGIVEGKEKDYKFRVLDYYDHEKEVSAMARTTGYTAAIVAGMLSDGVIKQKGIVTPERLGMNHEFTERLMKQLGKRGIKVESE